MLTFGLVQFTFGNTAPPYFAITARIAAFRLGSWYTGTEEEDDELASDAAGDGGRPGLKVTPWLPSGRKMESESIHYCRQALSAVRGHSEGELRTSRNASDSPSESKSMMVDGMVICRKMGYHADIRAAST